MPPRELRQHQADAIGMLRESLRKGNRRPILMAPTGYGKTVVAGNIINSAIAKGNRVTFVVPAISLVDQTVNSFRDDGITEIGVIQADHHMTDWSKPIQVASIQTIARKGYPKCDLVLVDECHKVFNAQTLWMAHCDWRTVPFIGLSATPWTKGLGHHYDDLIISATTESLIKQKFLSPFRVFAADHPDLTKVKTVAGDYHEGQLAEAMNQLPLVANVVETWVRQGEERATLCFAVNCAHAKHLQMQFEQAGIPCGYIDAYTDIDDRNIVAGKFKRGEYKVVCNVGTLTTGIDWDVRCIILVRPTKSEMLFVQIVGRGLRTAEGKSDCLILDHSDTHSRLGFVTDINYDTLDTGKEKSKSKEKKEKLPKECRKCHALRAVGVVICPSCGHICGDPPAIKHIDGNLMEIDVGKGTRDTCPKGSIRFGNKIILLKEFYGQLKSYAETRSYKPGWAANKYREAVGVWPNAHKDAPPHEISREVLAWIKANKNSWKRADANRVEQKA